MTHERKNAEHPSDAELRLRAILDTAVEGIIVLDFRGIILSFNKAAEKIFGYHSAEVVSKNVSILMPSPDRELHDQYVGTHLKTGKARIIGIGREVRGLRKDGGTFPLALAVSEIGTGDGRQFVGLIRDISHRKQLEEALVMATENERMIIGQELHDTLSQQLAAIAMMTRALEKRIHEDNKGARSAAADVATMARDATNVAKRLAHGLFPTELERNGLASALEELADNQRLLFKKECRYTGVKRRLGMPRPVDRNLYRIAQEAVSNAVKHSGADHIDIMLEVTPLELLLTVQDDGIGLPHHQQPGKGMGLAIMKYRAGMINASLTISSSPRKGTTVTCRLPDWEKTANLRNQT